MRFINYGIVAVCALSLSACIFSAGAEEGGVTPPPACHLQRAALLDMFPDDAHRPVVKISLDGTLEYFLVDTAGVYNAVSSDTAEALKMLTHKGDLNLVHTVSGKDIDTYVNGKLQIGPLSLPRIPMAVIPSDIMSKSIQGLLGGEFLRVFDLEIDPAAKQLSFFLHSDCGARVVHWTSSPYAVLDFEMNNRSFAGNWMVGSSVHDYHIVVPARLNGSEVSATIDTGADVSFMNMGDAEDLLSADELKQMKPVDDKADKNADPDKIDYIYKFKSVELNGIAVRNLKVMIFPGRRSHAEKSLDGKPQLTIGNDVLNKLHVYIAYDQHKLYITGAGVH